MEIVVIGWIVLAVGLGALWARQQVTLNATSVDVAWSAGLVFLSFLYPWFVDGDPVRRAIVGTLGGIWALRLAWHLLSDRVLAHREEDGRYKALRKHWGSRAGLYFFFFYQGQAAVAVMFSLPIYAAMHGGQPGALTWVGIAVWVIAVGGETIADRQLAAFRADPSTRGQVCREGLWRYSRHPNYFFEWIHWWSYTIIGGGAALTWLGPAAMFLFLFHVTGIPYTEMQALRSRGEAYRKYQATTSVFVPWPPKGETL